MQTRKDKSDPSDGNECCIKGCSLPVLTLHLCTKHWRRLRKHGSPIALRSRVWSMAGLSDEERFFSQIHKTPGCWLWAGATDSYGYGVFRGTVDGVTYTKAHRFSVALHMGKPIAASLVVMHSCDNRRCVNPAHLSIGTTRENVLDKFSKGRGGLCKEVLFPKITLTDAQIQAIAIDSRTNTEVAANYGVTAKEIAKIREDTPNIFMGSALDPNRVCGIKGCDAPVSPLGLCSDHWRRCSEFGAPTIDKPHFGKWVALPAMDRLMSQIQQENGCWIWVGSTDKDGYGRIRAKIGSVEIVKAHVLSYVLHTGEIIPKGMVVMHSCDNPRCVNPNHLSVGTYKENSLDMFAKGRANVRKGEDAPGALLSRQDVEKILSDARPYEQIAADHGVARSTIGSIKQRKSWRDIEVGEIARAKRVGMRGEKQWGAKLTETIVREIRSSLLAAVRNRANMVF